MLTAIVPLLFAPSKRERKKKRIKETFNLKAHASLILFHFSYLRCLKLSVAGTLHGCNLDKNGLILKKKKRKRRHTHQGKKKDLNKDTRETKIETVPQKKAS